MNDKKIDLKRMEELVNNFGGSENVACDNNSDDIKMIMNHKGYSIGFNGNSIDFNKTLKSLKGALSEALGLYINFIINDKITINGVSDCIEQINNYINDDADVMFATEINNDIDINQYEYQILITGLKNRY